MLNLLDNAAKWSPPGGRIRVQMKIVDDWTVVLEVADQGPGIADIEVALRDGYTTGHGLGLGLGGAKRLSSEFHIESWPGHGTRVRIARWR